MITFIPEDATDEEFEDYFERWERATALSLASQSVRATFTNVKEMSETILSIADEFLQYMRGDDTAIIPRFDTPEPGKLPKTK